MTIVNIERRKVSLPDRREYTRTPGKFNDALDRAYSAWRRLEAE